MRRLRVGLIGCGTVGSCVAAHLTSRTAAIADRFGVSFEISRIAVRDLARIRPGIDRRLLTTSPDDVIDDSDVVIELMGGVSAARRWVAAALSSRRHVITANKALLAEAGAPLMALAAVHGVELRYEASVCAGIPVIRLIRQALAGDRVVKLRGVMNGTCNFVLTELERGASFDAALQKAQQLGFAEADPALDLNGSDAAHKIAILAQLAFPDIPRRWLRSEGILAIDRLAVQHACVQQRRLRLVASATVNAGAVDLSVGPELLSIDDPLAHLVGEENAISIDAAHAGHLFLRGPGAGANPTASAVLGDLLELAGTWDVGWRGWRAIS